MSRTRRLSYLASAIAAALAAGPAVGAQLIYDGDVLVKGTGQGAVPTILTIQQPPGETTETGCVLRSGASDVEGTTACNSYGSPFTGGNDQKNAQTQTQPFSAAGITDYDEVAIVLDVAQAGGGSVKLEDMALRIYKTDNTQCAEIRLAAVSKGYYSGAGGGQSSHPFIIDNPSAVAAAAACGPFDPDMRVGLAGKASEADDGPESWWLGAVAGAPPSGSARVCVDKVVTSGDQDYFFTFNATSRDSQKLAASGGVVCFNYTLPTSVSAIPVDVSEVVPEGWELEEIACDGGGPKYDSPSVGLTLEDQSDVLCTFTNREIFDDPGEICVAKKVVPSGYGIFDFSITNVTGFETYFEVASGGEPECTEVAAGKYTVAEDVPNGWSTPSVNCGSGSVLTSAIDVTVTAGGRVDCEFTNTPVASPSPKPIPTVSVFGLGALALMLAAVARRRMR